MKLFLFILMISTGLYMFGGCTKESSSIKEILSTAKDPVVETYNNTPANDPNDLDRKNAENVLPEKKLSAKYKYKISSIGVFDHNSYLAQEEHKNDAVISYPGTDGFRVVRIYTNNPIIDKRYY